jgi:phosphatidate cytidylyltransferase
LDASVRERGATGLGAQALTARVTSGLLCGVLALAAVWAGGWIFVMVLGIVLLAGLWEFLRMAGRAGHPVLIFPGLAAGAAVIVLASVHDSRNAGGVLVAIGLAMVALSLRPPIERRTVGLAVTLLGVAYVTGLGLHLLWLRESEDGLRRLTSVLLGTWAADTFAFFVGFRFGRRPLAPSVSPAKSVEGLLGGVLGATVVTALALRALLPEAGWLPGLVVGAVIGTVAPAGDLIESLFKRKFGQKDSSRVIPGHGGILDRIDSLLITAPVAVYLFRWLLP